MIVQYTGDQFEAFRFMRWTLGGIQLVGFSEVLRSLPVLLLIFGASLYSSMELDLMVCGDDMAVSRGVNVEKSDDVSFCWFPGPWVWSLLFAAPSDLSG